MIYLAHSVLDNHTPFSQWDSVFSSIHKSWTVESMILVRWTLPKGGKHLPGFWGTGRIRMVVKREGIPGHEQKQKSSCVMSRLCVEIETAWVKSLRDENCLLLIRELREWPSCTPAFPDCKHLSPEARFSTCYLPFPTTFRHESFSLTEPWPGWHLRGRIQGKSLLEEGTKVLFLQRNMLSAQDKNTSFIPNLSLMP